MGISKRAFARQIGVSDRAVRNAIADGRLSVQADGTIDPVAGAAQWASKTDPARSRVRPARVPTVQTEDDACEAVSLVRRVLKDEGADSSGTIDFDMARIAETILKSHERELKMAQRRKELVPIAAVKSHVEKAFIGLRQAIQRLPSRHVAAIAAEIGCDPGKLDAALSKAIAAELELLSKPVVRA